MSFQLVTTADGSLSCRDERTGELCHNRVGAYTESVHFYAQPSGLLDLALRQGEIRVLDACYGLGYNSWSLINELLRLENSPQFLARFPEGQPAKPITVSLVCIEMYPEVLTFLPQVLDFPTFDTLKQKLIPSEHNTYYRTLQCFYDTKGEGIGPRKFVMDVAPFWHFELELWVDDLRSRVPQLEVSFDAVFHDPFSPQKMPELWTADLFREYHRLLKPRNGKLLTYCAAAAVWGGLQEIGFQVSKVKGLGTKSGGTLAMVSDRSEQTESSDYLQPLEAWEQEYLASRASIPYRDQGLKLTRKAILDLREREQSASSLPSGSQALKKKPQRAKL